MLKKLGKYEIIELVGHGAMGAVYKARDPSIERLVALKTITGWLGGSKDLVDRFYREARSAGALQHQNIVTVYELAQERKTPFIAMEFIEGESLDKTIERRPNLPVSQKVEIIVQICRALDCAHRHGVVHRDIKPANVMLAKDGTVKVVDFGIARLVDTSHTQSNMLVGTIAYMAPEQFQGERANQCSDIWSLGALSFELLSYRRPYDAENASALILSIVDEKNEPPSLRDHLPEISPDLQAIVDKMLKKDPNERFQTIEEILFEIEPLSRKLQEESVSELIAESETLVEAQDFLRARELLRKALRFDRRNERANLLLEKATAGLRLFQMQSEAKDAVARGQSFLQQERFKEARAEAEGALKLDPLSSAANDFLAEVDKAGERARQLQEGLQLARQRLVEGALTEAADVVRRLLSLDPTNAPAHMMQKQIQDLQARRADRKRRSEVLQQARECWAGQRPDECIEQLSAALQQFPGDSEITNLLEAAKQEQAELLRQRKLAEAKSLLAKQQFDDALGVLELLSTRHPQDPVVQKLIELASHEREDFLRQQNLQALSAELHLLVNAGRYSEAISKGESFLQEFPNEGEFSELVTFARFELAKDQQKISLDEVLERIRGMMETGAFSEAIKAAETAQVRFPHHQDLESLLQQARESLKKEKARQFLNERILEIRRRINRRDFTDAVYLARETLAINGPDAQLTQMLSAAEMELAQKQQRADEQDKLLAEARDLLDEGQFQAASQILLEGTTSRILDEQDSRVRRLLLEIREREPAAAPSRTEEILELEKEPAGEDAGKEYIFQHLAALEETSSGLESVSATAQVSDSFKEVPVVAPAPSASLPVTANDATPSNSQESLNEQRDSNASTVKSSFDGQLKSALMYLIQFAKANAIRVCVGAAVILILIIGVRYLFSRRTAREMGLFAQAQQLERQKKWPEALSIYETLTGGTEAVAKESRDRAARMKFLLEQESYFSSRAQSAESSGDIPEAKLLYQHLADVHGDLEQQAVDAIDRLRKTEVFSENSNDTGKSGDANKERSNSSPARVPSESKTCVLTPSLIPKHLERADDYEANGDYEDARREYNSVLACEQKNQHALDGLKRTKAAEATVHKPRQPD